MKSRVLAAAPEKVAPKAANPPARVAARLPSTPSLSSAVGNQSFGRMMNGGGRPLEGSVRREMESRFQADLGGVRIHTGLHANQRAQAEGAFAFAHGADIVFGAGQYNPRTPRGRSLLAHELAHVVQQSRGSSSSVGESASEADARQAAAAVVSGGQALVGVSSAPVVARHRIDYEADPLAYQDLELAYAAEGDYPSEGLFSPGVYRSKYYWLAPHLRTGTERVVYYSAYNPEAMRIEYIIGPNRVKDFVASEQMYRFNAAAAYPLVGEPPKYKALSGKVASRAVRGDLSGAWRAWKASWVAAVKDPDFWVQSTLATAGAAAAAEARAAAAAGRAAGAKAAAGAEAQAGRAAGAAAGEAPAPRSAAPAVGAEAEPTAAGAAQPGGAPKLPPKPGTLVVEGDRALSTGEQAGAKYWLDQGKNVRAPKPVGELPKSQGGLEGVRTADLEVEGVGKVDIYNPEPTTSANRVVGGILDKSSQTQVVQVDLAPGSAVTAEQVAKFPGRVFGHPTAGKGITRIVVRQGGKVLLDEVRK